MIKIGIVGTGGMGGAQAKAFNSIPGCKLIAACDVDQKRVEAFAKEHGIKSTYTDYDQMLAEAGLDAVTNVTPDPFHAPLTLKAIAKGLHVLCEKPLALNYAEAKKMAQAAKRKGVINMVQFSYRAYPALQKATKMVEAGEIGNITHFEASYLQNWLVSKAWGDWRTTDTWLWRQSTKHGSNGVLGDIGVHILDMTTFPMANNKVSNIQCKLSTLNKLKGKKHAGYTLDANDSAVMTLQLDNGAIGTVHTSRWATGHHNHLRLRLHGDKGSLFIDGNEQEILYVCKGKDIDKGAYKAVKAGKPESNFKRFIRSIKTRKNEQPDFARGAEIQKMLDACSTSDKSGKAVKL